MTREEEREMYRKEREGQVYRNAKGEEYKVIRYNNCKDVDVEFTTGEIRRGLLWCAVVRGGVGRREKGYKIKEKYVGEMVYDGDRVGVVKGLNIKGGVYVEYGDGEVVEMSVRGLKRKLKNPKEDKRVGERYQTSKGEFITIVAVNGVRDVTVRWDDGYERSGLIYYNVRRGIVSKRDWKGTVK